ncbi:EAL and HDOD domain-containing protein [Iodobacter fluviatilis]|uniref:EAL and modified HD-GYP domain-containing signal transduction protein n=1 Tax=Iodobacter fluviatilis TaxID=537 RepID=A0A377QDD0_9NEIS|nr:EAL domain-containing protein [Iodobacter fluviatilis]TCU81774.1 EAL and modified HD-GYP domain-containing signal transduction protein [Iodobacter fluviatilis]STQ91881.1 Predicted signal transduction protein containing sensor and EAL domains [Iodobacter fluviatilis]
MQNSYHLGRQPILNRQQELVAYELLFRNSSHRNEAIVPDDFLATLDVIQHAFSTLGASSVLGDKLGFINVSADLLMSDVLELLPPQQVVLEILETVEITPTIIERCLALKKKGFKLALDDIIHLDDTQKALLPHLSFAKLEVMDMQAAQMSALIKELRPYPLQILAEKVDNPDQHQLCMQLGFDLFQGYYFAKPTILSGSKPQPSQMALLRLLGLINSNADNHDIELSFKHSPDLTINLLKLVNSVGSGTPKKIDSLAAAITVLGRRQLGRWIHLLAYVQQSGKNIGSNPLVQTAAIRGKFMELLALKKKPRDQSFADQAFMVGMFSLIDVLFNAPLQELIEPLNLNDDVRDALTGRNNALGELLNQALLAEDNDPQLSHEIPSDFDALLSAMSWANELG